MVETAVPPSNGAGDINTPQATKIAYFAVGPCAHEITCPFCKITGKTIIKRRIFRCQRFQFCSSCGEYLGVFRRPQL